MNKLVHHTVIYAYHTYMTTICFHSSLEQYQEMILLTDQISEIQKKSALKIHLKSGHNPEIRESLTFYLCVWNESLVHATIPPTQRGTATEMST